MSGRNIQKPCAEETAREGREIFFSMTTAATLIQAFVTKKQTLFELNSFSHIIK